MHRRPSIRDRAAALTAAALLACAGLGWPQASDASQAAPLREIGAGSLHWFGLHVYDARLAVAGERFDPAQPFALTLRYARDLSGDRIAEAMHRRDPQARIRHAGGPAALARRDAQRVPRRAPG
jgi:hypothetical protein